MSRLCVFSFCSNIPFIFPMNIKPLQSSQPSQPESKTLPSSSLLSQGDPLQYYNHNTHNFSLDHNDNNIPNQITVTKLKNIIFTKCNDFKKVYFF
jgi:hypothetical protein